MKKLITLLVLSSSLVACNSTQTESPEQIAITAVYKLDKDVLATSKTSAELVTKLNTINVDNCPPEFKTSFRSFIKAWDDFADLEKVMYTQDMSKATKDIQAFISSYTKTPSEATVKLKEQWPNLASKIDSVSAKISKSMADYISVGDKYNVVFKQDRSIFDF